MTLGETGGVIVKLLVTASASSLCVVSSDLPSCVINSVLFVISTASQQTTVIGPTNLLRSSITSLYATSKILIEYEWIINLIDQSSINLLNLSERMTYIILIEEWKFQQQAENFVVWCGWVPSWIPEWHDVVTHRNQLHVSPSHTEIQKCSSYWSCQMW
jgi:hypothetical protein